MQLLLLLCYVAVKTEINDAYGHVVQHHHYEVIECPGVKTHPNTAYAPVETSGKILTLSN